MPEWRARGLTWGRLRFLAGAGDLIRGWPGVYAPRSAVRWGQGSAARLPEGHVTTRPGVKVTSVPQPPG